MHTVFIGIGSNLGDRQGNILQALQKLRARAAITAVSASYESDPRGNVAGPAFLNVAAKLETELEPEAFDAFARRVETAVGRQRAAHLAARPIDIDILAIEGIARNFGRFEVPHPYLADRPYNLLPLAEIVPELVEPRTGKTIAELAAANIPGIRKLPRTLRFFANRQEEVPAVRLSLNRVGVSGVKRLIRLRVDGREAVYNGEFSMVADLAPDKAGVHMSRFSEVLEEATLDVLARLDTVQADELAGAVAAQIVGSQRALRADVRLRAQFALERWTPVSGKRGEEIYTLIGIAHAGETGIRRVFGVEAEGMTACPCAQLMVREHGLAELIDAGFSEADAARALDALPVATHNQRGLGAVLIGMTGEPGQYELRAEDLVEIVENSMSSETYGLLKRPDEFFVVNKAHHNPKFVEDVVRGILARSLDVYGDFPDDSFVFASQVNYESIHKHDAFAEAYGTFGELRSELASRSQMPRRTDLASWLGTQPSAVVA